VSANDDKNKVRVQEQPWWTTGSKVAIGFLVVSNLAVLLTIFVPAISQWRDRHLQGVIATSDRNQQKQIAEANQTLESLNRQVEVTRLLFDHFFGKPSSEQKAVISYLTYQFPRDLRKQSLQAILYVEAPNAAVRKQIDQSVASIQPHPLGQTSVDAGVANERSGFQSLVNGDLAKARAAFLAAYAAYPHYHNVDEISHRVLTQRLVTTYGRSTPRQQRAIEKQALGLILSAYSWGIPTDLLPKLRAVFNRT
jgi:hypothetical protein